MPPTAPKRSPRLERRSTAPFAPLGGVIRDHRKRRSLSLQQVADATGISRRQVALIESGANVSLEYLARLIEHFDIRELPLRGGTPLVKSADYSALREARSRAMEAAQTVTELLRRVAIGDEPSISVRPSEESRLRITLAEEEQMAALREAIVDAPRSMVQWRTGYRGDPSKYVVKRKGRAAAGHGALPDESAEEKRRQIPEHYWEALGARDTLLLDGESLADLGYVDHDLLFVRPIDGRPKNNDVIVCRRGPTGEKEILVKVFALFDGRTWLLSANEREAGKYPPIAVDEDPTFEVLGVVTGRSGYALRGSRAPRPAAKPKAGRNQE
jgi:transcriptional regulator with XRE-family HTH domain